MRLRLENILTKSNRRKILICILSLLSFLVVIFLLLAVYHSLLIAYQEIFLIDILKLDGSVINIGVIGDSLAVLSFIALIYSLILNIKELRLNREEFEKSNEIRIQELEQNKEQSEIDNKLRAKCEVLENLRSLGENSKQRNKTIISFNLFELIEYSLEILVKIIREGEEGYLKEFAEEFIKKNKGNLSSLDLSGQNFSCANLKTANLIRTNLSRTNLSYTKLNNAYLLSADLQGAFLQRTNFSVADLSGANLSGADLQKAKLLDANLFRTIFSNANLLSANLLTAKNLTIEQLSKAKTLYKAILDPELEKQIKKKHPELLKKPTSSQ